MRVEEQAVSSRPSNTAAVCRTRHGRSVLFVFGDDSTRRRIDWRWSVYFNLWCSKRSIRL